MSSKCQNHAGILDNNDKLTLKAKNRFIEDVINEMRFGTPSLQFPCGDPIAPVAFAELIDLYDEKMYADWHATWPPKYEALAQALNVAGGMPFFPLFGDITIVLKLLDVDISLGLKAFQPPTPKVLLPYLKLSPPELAAKLPTLKIPIPDLPKFQSLPTPFPPEFDLDMIGLGFFLKLFLKLPDIFMSLIVPDIALKILPLNVFLGEICKLIREKVFMPNTAASGVDLSYAAAAYVLTRKLTELMGIAVTASLIGSSPNGVVGGMGADMGYRDPPGEAAVEGPDEFSIRDEYVSEIEVAKNEDEHARNDLIVAFRNVMNRNPTLREAQFAQTIGRIENGYGRVWIGRSSNAKIPPEAKQSNNWGSVHGSGPAGSFSWKDFNSQGKSYTQEYAMFGSQVEGAMELVKHLYVLRPYILDSINDSDSLYKPVYLMSSRAVWGTPGYIKHEEASTNALIPPKEGGLTYYEAHPDVYFKAVLSGLNTIMKRLDESTSFDTVTKSLA